MIRLAAFDLDQTLFGSDLVISPRVQRAVAQAQGRGVIVTIATGREARLTARFARELNLTAPLVCAQGALVYDYLTDRTLHDVRLPGELLPKVIEATARHGWNLHFEMPHGLFLPKHSNHPPILFDLIRLSQWSRLDDFLRDLPEPPLKFIITLNTPDERERVMAEMRAEFDGLVNIVASHTYLIEGLPAGVDKGRGVAWLAEYFHIPQAEVMAVGDNDNDVPMIQWAGIGVAVGNASPAAQAAADWVAPPVEEDGAAAALEKFVLDISPKNAG
jgi:Cof subfamily protein (haloacid dehalogenase superfamily)